MLKLKCVLKKSPSSTHDLQTVLHKKFPRHCGFKFLFLKVKYTETEIPDLTRVNKSVKTQKWVVFLLNL